MAQVEAVQKSEEVMTHMERKINALLTGKKDHKKSEKRGTFEEVGGGGASSDQVMAIKKVTKGRGN